MKTLDANTLTINEETKAAAGGKPAEGRSWTFADPHQAAKHTAQFQDVPGFAEACEAKRAELLEAAAAAAAKR